jgi:peptidoglycan hydrolase CwlO-like protein
METSSGNSLWPWIIGGLGLVVGIVALVIAISANNNSTSDKSLVNETAAQVQEEISGVGGAVSEASETAAAGQHQAARGRARIRREVRVAVHRASAEFESVNTSNADLDADVKKLRKQLAGTNAKAAEEIKAVEGLEREVASLKKRVSRLEG